MPRQAKMTPHRLITLLVVVVAAINGSLAVKARDSLAQHMMNLGAIIVISALRPTKLRWGPMSYR
jgi:uncharacterized membrane protein